MLLTFVAFAIGAGVQAVDGPDVFTAPAWPFWLLAAGAIACLEIGHRHGWTHR
jgi:hypothetical protein